LLLAYYKSSGVARVPCALGQEIFFRPPSAKIAEFEVKNRYKVGEDVNAGTSTEGILLFYEGNKSRLMLEANSTNCNSKRK